MEPYFPRKEKRWWQSFDFWSGVINTVVCSTPFIIVYLFARRDSRKKDLTERQLVEELINACENETEQFQRVFELLAPGEATPRGALGPPSDTSSNDNERHGPSDGDDPRSEVFSHALLDVGHADRETPGCDEKRLIKGCVGLLSHIAATGSMLRPAFCIRPALLAQPLNASSSDRSVSFFQSTASYMGAVTRVVHAYDAYFSWMMKHYGAGRFFLRVPTTILQRASDDYIRWTLSRPSLRAVDEPDPSSVPNTDSIATGTRPMGGAAFCRVSHFPLHDCSHNSSSAFSSSSPPSSSFLNLPPSFNVLWSSLEPIVTQVVNE